MDNAIIKFNKKLYKYDSIKKAKEAFAELADFSLKREDEYYIVEISKAVDHSLDELKDEFCNYVLQYRISQG